MNHSEIDIRPSKDREICVVNSALARELVVKFVDPMNATLACRVNTTLAWEPHTCLVDGLAGHGYRPPLRGILLQP